MNKDPFATAKELEEMHADLLGEVGLHSGALPFTSVAAAFLT